MDSAENPFGYCPYINHFQTMKPEGIALAQPIMIPIVGACLNRKCHFWLWRESPIKALRILFDLWKASIQRQTDEELSDQDCEICNKDACVAKLFEIASYNEVIAMSYLEEEEGEEEEEEEEKEEAKTTTKKKEKTK